MSHKIPPEDVVINILFEIIKKHKIIHSQHELVRKLEEKLTKINPMYCISGRRARLITIKSNKIKLEIKYRKDKTITRMVKCPVCGSKVKPIKNKTVYNWEITVGYRCNRCGYWTGKKKQIPIRYIFSMKSNIASR